MSLNTKGGAMLRGVLHSGSTGKETVRQASLCPVCGVYYLVNCWQCLGVIGASSERPARLSDGDCASAEIVGLKGSNCTPAAWRERRNLQRKGSDHRGHETEEIGRVFGEFPAR